MLPVIIFFFSPSRGRGAWISVKDFIKNQQYHGNTPVKKITVKLENNELKIENFSVLRSYGKIHFDSKKLFECVDRCLSENEREVFDNFMILANHPHSRDSKITLFMARNLLKTDNTDNLKTILFILGYGVGRHRWSWNPKNEDEQKIMGFACDMCSDLTKEEIYKLLSVADNESFHGAHALGERLFDIISCCPDTAVPVLELVASNKSEPIERRLNALYLIYECDDENIQEAYKSTTYQSEYADLFKLIFEENKV